MKTPQEIIEEKITMGNDLNSNYIIPRWLFFLMFVDVLILLRVLYFIQFGY